MMESLRVAATGQSTARPLYDVCNGDADGLCALHQYRLAHPARAQLITGVKRDIALLERIPCESEIGEMDVTVLDISLDSNVDSLRRILDRGGRVSYFDHHSARLAFLHPRLNLFWDDSPLVCTSVLVDRFLGGRYRRWAIAAAFGDNLDATARMLAQDIGLTEADTLRLAELGRALNYNAYGESLDDLHFSPHDLYGVMSRFADPFDFINSTWQYRNLLDGYFDDIACMRGLTPHWKWQDGEIYLMPNAKWARRVSGTFANELTSRGGAMSFAVLTENKDGSYVVSVRSGAPASHAAHVFCEQFPGGGGRQAAAGINRLPNAELERFIRLFSAYFTLTAAPTAGGEAHAG